MYCFRIVTSDHGQSWVRLNVRSNRRQGSSARPVNCLFERTLEEMHWSPLAGCVRCWSDESALCLNDANSLHLFTWRDHVDVITISSKLIYLRLGDWEWLMLDWLIVSVFVHSTCLSELDSSILSCQLWAVSNIRLVAKTIGSYIGLRDYPMVIGVWCSWHHPMWLRM